jgi:hypothetical protein
MTPDRVAVEAEQGAWARSMAHRPEPAEDTRTHADEVRQVHGCVPSPEAAVAMGVTPASGGRS